ncbi:hypothetical protein GQ53DRAFT_837952 [Thozetella sp. PMI_491]|nr:hypothetical protein GQ53DRAFT_837952 [Thozetella sp. PMI_491]
MGKSAVLPSVFRTAGWRRTAAVNTVLGIALCAVLATILIRSAALAGSVDRNLIFYHGSCTTSGRLNLGLHLIINIASTCVIASSNYFVQVLSSPTRQEIDNAHRQFRSLEIGVPSLRNIGHISHLKAALCALFVLSSVPIHVLFNSAVFETDYQGAGFFMAMATEDFVSGRDSAMLGASLIYPGALEISHVAYPDMELPMDLTYAAAWGSLVDLSQFLNRSSDVAQSISSLSSSALSWTRLDAQACRAQYGTCTPRRDYGDVVLILDSRFQRDAEMPQSNSAGFVVDDIFNLTEAAVFYNPRNYSTSEVRAYWDQFWPVDQPNPLWFSASCKIDALVGLDSTCYHSCARPLNAPRFEVDSRDPTSWSIPLELYSALPKNGLLDLWSETTIEERPAFNGTNIGPEAHLEVTHCYAQPLQFTCKVALSNAIFFAVTAAVIFKVVLALLACTLVRGDPLVTPGDAMASFITHPDRTTEGRAAVIMPGGSQELRDSWVNCPVGLKWCNGGRPRIGAGIPILPWLRTYALLTVVLVCTAFFLNLAIQDTSISEDTGAFAHGQRQNDNIVGVRTLKDVSFLGKVLLANTPQLVLSLCYFAYNALFTRACSEMEWNSYANSYKPLRVSYPAEGQISTYRLQLPYRYSIPLLSISVLLHWLVSNTIFVTIIDGDFLRDSASILPGLSERAYVAVGFSSRAILVVFLLALVVALLPLGFYLRLKGNMVICGNNSFTISAACHVSTWNVRKNSLRREDSIEMQPQMDDQAAGANVDGGLWRNESKRSRREPVETESLAEDDMRVSEALLQVSRSQLRWGVVPMSPEWYDSFKEDGYEVEHLTFGTKDQGVEGHQVGRYYA